MSPGCYAEVYCSDPLEEGEIDVRKNSFKEQNNEKKKFFLIFAQNIIHSVGTVKGMVFANLCCRFAKFSYLFCANLFAAFAIMYLPMYAVLFFLSLRMYATFFK